jgi:phenylalanyl-tRNA synthetase beta subunit
VLIVNSLIILPFSGTIEIDMKFSINTIQRYIIEVLPEPSELERLFTFHLCEVEGLEECADGHVLNGVEADVLIDLNILPNRAHDMLGHYGVARELAGQLGLTLKPLLEKLPPRLAGTPSEEGDTAVSGFPSMGGVVRSTGVVSVKVETDKCIRYMARRIDGVTVGESTEDTKSFLAKLGQRSISNVVDATNQVMWLTSQPTHIFDADKVTGGITVRQARANEMITLLDGKEMKLDESIMVIADDVAVLAIAGIKGGKHAEVDTNTQNIILEVANFDASMIRKTAQKLGLRTDASYRFERDISPSVCDEAMELLTGFVCGGGGAEIRVGDITDIGSAPLMPTVIEFNLADISRVSGASISNADVTNILQRYGFSYIEREGNFSVSVPFWRLDLVGRHDMIEEMVRIGGLDRITPVAPPVLSLHSNLLEELISSIRNHMIEQGYSEVMTYSFRDSGVSRVLASAGDKSYLRQDLHEGFMESLTRNYRNSDLLEVDVIKQFEIGTVFAERDETARLCVGIHSKKQKGISDELWQVVSDMLYASGLTEIAIHECVVHRDDYIIELNISQIASLITKPHAAAPAAGHSQVHAFVEWSKYPYITRDIAVWTPEGTSPSVLETIYRDLSGELLVRVPRLIDQFTKDGRISYAHRLVFQSHQRTLEDVDIKHITDAIYAELARLGFEAR